MKTGFFKKVFNVLAGHICETWFYTNVVSATSITTTCQENYKLVVSASNWETAEGVWSDLAVSDKKQLHMSLSLQPTILRLTFFWARHFVTKTYQNRQWRRFVAMEGGGIVHILKVTKIGKGKDAAEIEVSERLEYESLYEKWGTSCWVARKTSLEERIEMPVLVRLGDTGIVILRFHDEV